MRWLVLAWSAAILAGCAPSQSRIVTSEGIMAPLVAGSEANTSIPDDYRIGPTDELSVAVFQVPDLSFEKIRVDAQGNLEFPLVGSLRAAGRTPAELSGDIAAALGSRYLRSPQVTVTVMEAASQKITVDGAVTKPGVYLMRGRTTLLQAIAMAEGPSRTAALDTVAVFRTVDGRRMAAVFNLADIRAGRTEDPVMLGDDIVVVDTSRTSVALREMLAALPALSVFAYLR
jgi:polysaccharide export outer membrane protein